MIMGVSGNLFLQVLRKHTHTHAHALTHSKAVLDAHQSFVEWWFWSCSEGAAHDVGSVVLLILSISPFLFRISCCCVSLVLAAATQHSKVVRDMCAAFARTSTLSMGSARNIYSDYCEGCPIRLF